MATVLGFLGSPRKNGNSNALLTTFFKALKDKQIETEVIKLNNINFRLCQSCDACAKGGNCVLKDDMQEIFEKVKRASGLVIASPIYFASMSAQTKVCIDRFQGWWNAKYRLKQPFVSKSEERPAFFISVGAVENLVYHENANQIAKMFFSVINYKHLGSSHYTGYDEAGEITRNQKVMDEIYQEGIYFADYLNSPI